MTTLIINPQISDHPQKAAQSSKIHHSLIIENAESGTSTVISMRKLWSFTMELQVPFAHSRLDEILNFEWWILN